MQQRPQPPDLRAIQQVLGSGLLWFAVAILLIVVLLLTTIRFGRVTGEQVGIKLNRLKGEMVIIDESGMHMYNGLLSEFYVLDKTIRTIDMTGANDNLKVKTIDGSDAHVDLKIQYRIDPGLAVQVLQTSGPGSNYEDKWARDYVRSFCRNFLGELTTEEFYDSQKRQSRIGAARKEINERLKTFGLIIDNITISQRPQFYKEYEAKIKEKKEADQTVHEERSRAHAAKQKQEMLIVEQTNLLNVAVEEFKGQMEKRIIAAEAEAERSKRDADSYYEKRTMEAAALLYSMKQQAIGILAEKEAEAAGIKKLREALEGAGGRNMVKLEYAKKLKNIKISGRPYSVDARLERFEHLRSAETTGR